MFRSHSNRSNTYIEVGVLRIRFARFDRKIIVNPKRTDWQPDARMHNPDLSKSSLRTFFILALCEIELFGAQE